MPARNGASAAFQVRGMISAVPCPLPFITGGPFRTSGTNSVKDAAAAFARTANQRIPLVIVDAPDTGCCGMAGAFGFEADKFAVSQAIGERVLLPAVRVAAADTLIVADGFSCREQIEQATGRRVMHLAEVLAMARSEA